MKTKTLTIAIGLTMILTGIFVMTDRVEALNSPQIKDVYQSSLEERAVSIEWTSSNTGTNYSYELEEMNSGIKKDLAGSVSKYTFQNLSVGQSLGLRIRTYSRAEGYSSYSAIWCITVQRGYGNNNHGHKESSGKEYSWDSIGVNTWYYDYTVDDDAVYYEFKTSGRKDSKYHFACRGTGDKSVDMWLLNYGADPNDDDAWRFVAGGTKDSSSCTTKTLSLKPNSTYRLRAYFKYGWTDTPVNAVGGVQYRLKVTEIIAKPAKGRIITWKAGKRKATVKFVRLSKATQYQIAYKIKGGKYKYVYTKSKAKTIKKLKSKKLYYVKVRGQRLANGTYHSGPWSAEKRVKVK